MTTPFTDHENQRIKAGKMARWLYDRGCTGATVHAQPRWSLNRIATEAGVRPPNRGSSTWDLVRVQLDERMPAFAARHPDHEAARPAGLARPGWLREDRSPCCTCTVPACDLGGELCTAAGCGWCRRGCVKACQHDAPAAEPAAAPVAAATPAADPDGGYPLPLRDGGRLPIGWEVLAAMPPLPGTACFRCYRPAVIHTPDGYRCAVHPPVRAEVLTEVYEQPEKGPDGKWEAPACLGDGLRDGWGCYRPAPRPGAPGSLDWSLAAHRCRCEGWHAGWTATKKPCICPERQPAPPSASPALPLLGAA